MTIVAAVDRSSKENHIVQEAANLADVFEDDLHVVHVLGQSEFVELERTNVEDTGQAIEMDQIKEIAAEIANEAGREVTASFETVGLLGNAADEIIRYSQEYDARYIVIGGRKRSPVGKAIFGSVTQSVLLNTNKPVVTIMQDQE